MSINITGAEFSMNLDVIPVRKNYSVTCGNKNVYAEIGFGPKIPPE